MLSLIIIGTFGVTHSEKQENYNTHNMLLLNGTYYEKKGICNFTGKDAYFNTVYCSTNEQTKELRKILYPNGIKSPLGILHKLNEISLAYWYMDDGYLVQLPNRKPFVRLCTHGFTKPDNEAIIKWLWEKYNIKASLRWSSPPEPYKQKSFIELSVDGSDIFFNLTQKYIIKSMEYKLPDIYKSKDKAILNDQMLEYSASKIESVNIINKGDSRIGSLYDIMVEHTHNFIANGSVVHNCVDEFMRSGCTHMLFIDSDIGFRSDDVVSLLAIADPQSDKQIVCAPYPKKVISWEKVTAAVKAGFADKNPEHLRKFTGDYVFNAVGNKDIKIKEIAEVKEAGTGFMMIQRKALETFCDKYPQYLYKPDHARSKNFNGKRKIMQYFHCEIDPKTGRYLSEDYWFCHKMADIGIKTWLTPWIELNHVGTYVFEGALPAIAALGASPTIDTKDIK